ncbi:hypothetical protein SPRG_16727 [Saprolegnia parasitica CBS 223.65]|uniref:Uncharacterized protein n=1 Tax=Saprolegnia parasitica (strain CBS 223.65) TaxID=695850 RepID=A0A067BHE5_SAPPC|nr:hypothetical protein SPRG_16727 [Saprolegnia parasitica CBS 223.65]KDO17799.1 hypothetical protein SPRG_16727 [Saprolegnia parasitica CBS 223.65]|eukprot:XP_012211492.1 hypothetical protein SPRG_16727 [Saprolegnia parasitica CBS 223.65]
MDRLGLGARRRATSAARRATTADGLHENIKQGVATYDQEQRQQSRRATLGLAPDSRTLQAKLDALSKQAVSNRLKVGEINDRVGRILEEFDDATTDAMLPYDRLPVNELPSSQASHILESMRASLHYAVMAEAETLEDVPTEDTTMIPSTTDFIDDVLDSSRLQQRRLTTTALQLTKLTGLQRAELEEKIASLEGALSDAEHQYATLEFKHAALGKDVTRLSAEVQALKQTQTKLLSNLSDAKKEREAAEAALHLEAQTREVAMDATIRGLQRKELQMTRALREAEDRIKQLLEAPPPVALSGSPEVILPSTPESSKANAPVLPTSTKPESPPKPTLSRKTTSRAESIKASRIYAGAPVVYTHMDSAADSNSVAAPAMDTFQTKPPCTSSEAGSNAARPSQVPETILGQRIADAPRQSMNESQNDVTEASVTATGANTPRYAFLSRRPLHQASSVDLHSDKIPEEASINTLSIPVVVQAPTSARDVSSWQLIAHDLLKSAPDSLVLRLRFKGPAQASKSVSTQHWTLYHLATHAGIGFRIPETTLQIDASNDVLVVVKMQLGSSPSPANALDVVERTSHEPAPMLKTLHSITALSTATRSARSSGPSGDEAPFFTALGVVDVLDNKSRPTTARSSHERPLTGRHSARGESHPIAHITASDLPSACKTSDKSFSSADYRSELVLCDVGDMNRDVGVRSKDSPAAAISNDARTPAHATPPSTSHEITSAGAELQAARNASRYPTESTLPSSTMAIPPDFVLPNAARTTTEASGLRQNGLETTGRVLLEGGRSALRRLSDDGAATGCISYLSSPEAGRSVPGRDADTVCRPARRLSIEHSPLKTDAEPPRVADETLTMMERPRTSSGAIASWKMGMPSRGLLIGDGRPQTRPKTCACFKNADFFKNSARLTSHHDHCPLADEPRRRRRHSLAATIVLDKTVDCCLWSPASVNVVQIQFPTNIASNL